MKFVPENENKMNREESNLFKVTKKYNGWKYGQEMTAYARDTARNITKLDERYFLVKNFLWKNEEKHCWSLGNSVLNQKEAQQHLHKLQDERQLQSMTRKPKQGRSWQKIVQTKGYKLEEQLNKSLPRATKSFCCQIEGEPPGNQEKVEKTPVSY